MFALKKNKILKTGFLSLFLFIAFLFPLSFVDAQTPAQQLTKEQQARAAKDAEVEAKSSIMNWLGSTMLSTAGSFTWLAGVALEKSIEKTVLEMGTDMGSGSGIGQAVTRGWIVIRDFANLIFIFGLIFVGIRTILDSENAGTKRMLTQIIIGALLINFSLFFVKVVIDTGNILAIEIHQTILKGQPENTEGKTADIGTLVANQLGIVTLYTSNQDPKIFANLTAGGNVWFFVLGSVFLFIAAFVFLAGAVLLIVRYVALLFIMVFSPLLFAASVFPKTAGTASMLWQKLISYTFFAPAYFLLIYISLVLTGAMTDSIRGDGLSAALTNSSGGGSDTLLKQENGAGDVIISFIIISMFMIMSLQAAQKFGIKGGEAAIKIGNNLRGRGMRALGGITVGATAGVGRATVGQAAHRIAESSKLKDYASRSAVGKRFLQGARGVADSSFDARNISGVGESVGIGKGRKGGYKSVLDERTKKEAAFAKSLGELDDTDPNVALRKVEMESQKEQIEDLKEELNAIPKENLEERKLMRGKIAAAERDLQLKEQSYQREKNRRQTGSGGDAELTGNFTEQLEEARRELKGLSDDLSRIPATIEDGMMDERRNQMKKIIEKEKEIADIKRGKKLDTYQGGYAEVIENNFFTTNTPHMKKEIAGDIRKSYEKSIKKTKEDKRSDSIIAAVKETAKSGE